MPKGWGIYYAASDGTIQAFYDTSVPVWPSMIPTYLTLRPVIGSNVSRIPGNTYTFIDFHKRSDDIITSY